MDFVTFADRVQQNVAQVIIGKREPVDLLLVALLCDGHVLLEDVPGIGKTTLAKALSRSIDSSFARIQFTPDLLPSDIIDSGNLTIRILFALTIYNKNRHGLDISGGIERGLIIPETDLTIEIGNGYSY